MTDKENRQTSRPSDKPLEIETGGGGEQTLGLYRAALAQASAEFILADRVEGALRLRRFEALGLVDETDPGGLDRVVRDDPSLWQVRWPDQSPWNRGGLSLWEAVLGGERLDGLEVIVRTPDGAERWVEVNAAPIRGPAGEVVAGVFAFSDLQRVKMLEEERARILSMFAHDMKSPLIAASGFIERLLAGKTGPLAKKQAEYLEIIFSQVRRVQCLAQDFLDLARLSLDKRKMTIAQVDLGGILDGLRQEYQERAATEGLELVIEAQGGLPILMGDPGRLSRVLTNLLDNALKYAGQGRVTLAIRAAEPGGVVIDVLDQGPGLSREDLDQLFRPFFRGSAGTGTDGTGLGLAAVRAIVEAHGGWVEAANRDGGGARFTVFLGSAPGPDPRWPSGRE